MKHNKYPQAEKLTDMPSSIDGDANPTPVDFVPSAEEVSRKAYFAYMNERSPEGRDVQHWLDAEAELIRERNLTRVHGFHN